jgi:hypothetical protein
LGERHPLKALDLDMAIGAQAQRWEAMQLDELIRNQDEENGLGNALSLIIHLLQRR